MLFITNFEFVGEFAEHCRCFACFWKTLSAVFDRSEQLFAEENGVPPSACRALIIVPNGALCEQALSVAVQLLGWVVWHCLFYRAVLPVG